MKAKTHKPLPVLVAQVTYPQFPQTYLPWSSADQGVLARFIKFVEPGRTQ